MAVTIDIYVPDPATDLETYDEIILLKDSTPNGSFATQVGTASLLSTVYLYSIADAGGGAGTVYRYYKHNTTSGATSAYSEIFYPRGIALADLRLAAAREAAAGFDGTCSSVGTNTTLVDATLLDTGVSTDFLQGNWIYRPNALLSTDMMRRISVGGFNTTTGALTVNRAWSNAPASGEVYHVFGYFPVIDSSAIGMSWNRLIRRALREAWFVQQLNIGPGSPPTRRFSLAAYGEYFTTPHIRKVIRRYTDPQGVIHDFDCDYNGRFWNIVEDSPGNVSIDIWPAPLATEDVIVEVLRVDASVYQDADVTLCPYDYAIQAVAWQLYYQLNSEQPGKYAGELAAAETRFQRLQEKYRPAGVIRGA